MCGIAGIVAFAGGEPPQRETLQAMCDTIVHRGPDAEGLDLHQGVGLAARRLAIIDLESGDQPIVNEDGSVRTVFNGEIYNFRELREELSSRGHRFSTATDGEVIVHLWEEHGLEFATRLNGMFAIALHDLRRRQVVLVRDRVGIKPLFFSATPRHLVFGSEIKCLLASGRVEARLDLDALGQFLAWEYVPSPATLFAGVHKLEPGAMLVADLEREEVRARHWWRLPAAPDPANRTAGAPASSREWEEALSAKIRQCVRRQLVSDVPLGAFLSGGVDSSLVVSAMGPARAFSIGFDDASYDETRWAGRVAGHLGISHRVETLRPRAGELFDHLMQFMDDPIGDFSIFPTYLLSRLAREEVTVALSGDGGDELFGGYETFAAQRMAQAWSLVPGFVRRPVEEGIRGLAPRPVKKGLGNKLRRFGEGLAHPADLAHARWRLFVGERARRELFAPEALSALESSAGEHILELRGEAGERSELDRELYVDLRSYLVDNCLVKVDRMSMACSLEARVPLLDHELVEMAFRMPPRLKLRWGRTKPLLKRVAASQVPRECVYRPKEGFSMPMKDWLRGELRPLVEELLAPGDLTPQGIFRADTVERLKREHLERRADHSHILWSLIVFQDWTRRWGAT